jgi:predicted NBD/HSP70 family sugar kinase
VPLERGPTQEPSRPTRPLARDLDRFYAVGVKVRTDRLVGVLVDVDGEFLAGADGHREQRGVEHPLDATDVDSVVRGVAGLVAELLTLHPRPEPPVGLGVELSGQVDERNGVVRQSHRMGWHAPVPLAELLERATGLPTMVEHDVKALALAEQMFGRGQGRRSFAVVTAGLGVGAGLVINHNLWRGKSGTAGELGHMVVEPGRRRCSCGSWGCLETVAGSGGILQAVREHGRPDVPDIDAASRLAQQGDEVARRAFQEAGEILGRGLSWLVNLLDLELVVVRAEDALRDSNVYEAAARRSFEQYGFYEAARECELEILRYDHPLGARSAGSMVLQVLPDRLPELGDDEGQGGRGLG